jgi:hypothetical protein
MLAEENLPARAYAEKHGVGNQVTIQRMEHGKYDFSLSELVRISEIVGLPLEALFAL